MAFSSRRTTSDGLLGGKIVDDADSDSENHMLLDPYDFVIYANLVDILFGLPYAFKGA